MYGEDWAGKDESNQTRNRKTWLLQPVRDVLPRIHRPGRFEQVSMTNLKKFVWLRLDMYQLLQWLLMTSNRSTKTWNLYSRTNIKTNTGIIEWRDAKESRQHTRSTSNMSHRIPAMVSCRPTVLLWRLKMLVLFGTFLIMMKYCIFRKRWLLLETDETS